MNKMLGGKVVIRLVVSIIYNIYIFLFEVPLFDHRSPNFDL